MAQRLPMLARTRLAGPYYAPSRRRSRVSVPGSSRENAWVALPACLAMSWRLPGIRRRIWETQHVVLLFPNTVANSVRPMRRGQRPSGTSGLPSSVFASPADPAPYFSRSKKPPSPAKRERGDPSCPLSLMAYTYPHVTPWV
jgi:hypothetical protein